MQLLTSAHPIADFTGHLLRSLVCCSLKCILYLYVLFSDLYMDSVTLITHGFCFSLWYVRSIAVSVGFPLRASTCFCSFVLFFVSIQKGHRVQRDEAVNTCNPQEHSGCQKQCRSECVFPSLETEIVGMMQLRPGFEHLKKWSEIGVQTNTPEKAPARSALVCVASSVYSQH